MGLKITLTGVTLVNPSGAALAEVDPILPTEGALVLLDPSHPYEQWAAGVPTAPGSTRVVPNVAYDQAKALIPSGDTTTLGATLSYGASFLNDGETTLIERSGGGGLHVVFSQTNPSDADTNALLTLGSALRSYVLTNKAHSFYAAFWGRITRPHVAYTTGTPLHSYMNAAHTMASFFTRAGSAGETEYPADGTRIDHAQEGALAVAADAPLFQDIAVGTASAIPAVNGLAWFMAGMDGGEANNTRRGSMIFYGYYLEDLTVSERSYADVHELVYAKFERTVKTDGGRYHGDTYTDPATIP